MDERFARLTPAWLTDLLYTHKTLACGQVTMVKIESIFETPPSVCAKLTVAYSPNVPTDAPTQLFLKVPKAHKLARGKREIDFYAKIAPLMPSVSLVPCCGTRYDTETGISYLLLLDVSKTHVTCKQGLLSLSQFESMVSALAHLHTSWWNHTDLMNLIGESPQDSFAADIIDNEQNYAKLLQQLGEQITSEQRWIFERFLSDAPALILKRLQTGKALTLCHPENHCGNFLFPHQLGGSVYIIDWHQYGCWWGTKDLVGLFNRCMATEQLYLTKYLLRFYYECLLQYGIINYSWDECQQDYRLGIIDYLTILLQFHFVIQDYPLLFKRLFAAIMHEFEIWECRELFM